jgi:hypothetical protein
MEYLGSFSKSVAPFKKFLKACKKGNLKKIQELVRKHPDICKSLPDSYLYRKYLLVLMSCLCLCGTGNQACTWEKGRRPLHKACQFNQEQVMDFLLATGAIENE